MSAPPSLSNSEIASIALCSIKELDEPVFTPRQVSPEEKARMIEISAELDVDFLLIQHNCAKMLQEEAISLFFADLPVHFFQLPVRKKVYSQSFKQTLVFAKAGEYQIATPLSCVFEQEDENDDLYSAVSDVKNTRNWSTSAPYQVLCQKFSAMRRSFRQGGSFSDLKVILLEVFGDYQLVFFRYGQKIPLSEIATKICSIFHDAKIPIEIGFGKELSLPDHFLAAKFNADLRKFSYSVFLSNQVCNLRIDEPVKCQSFTEQSFHFAVYNTFHHREKLLDWVLKRETNHPEISLRAFRKSFYAINDKVKNLISELDSAKSRVEIYYSISSFAEYRKAKSSILEVIKELNLSAIPLANVKSILSQRRVTLKLLFELACTFGDSKQFVFFLYYSKFVDFFQFTLKMSKPFMESNIGMFLPEFLFRGETFELKNSVLELYTINGIHSLVEKIFGFSTQKEVCIVAHFFTLYVSKFLNVISLDEKNTQVAIRKISNFLQKKIEAPETNPQREWSKSKVSLQVFIDVLKSKFKLNKFFMVFLKSLASFEASNLPFFQKIETLLCKDELKIGVLSTNTLYFVSKNVTSLAANFQFSTIQELCKKYTYESFLQVLNSNAESISFVEFQNINFISHLFDEFIRMFVPKFDQFYYSNDFTTFSSKITLEVFASFFFLNIPIDPSGMNETTAKAAEAFNCLSSFFRFIFVGCMRYYGGFGSFPRQIRKYTGNTWVSSHFLQKYMKEDSTFPMTPLKAFYFTGRFDRIGPKKGLYLPLAARIGLVPRLQDPPYPQLTTGLAFVENENILDGPSNLQGRRRRNFSTFLADQELYFPDPQYSPSLPQSSSDEESIPAEFTEHALLNFPNDVFPIGGDMSFGASTIELNWPGLLEDPLNEASPSAVSLFTQGESIALHVSEQNVSLLNEALVETSLFPATTADSFEQKLLEIFPRPSQSEVVSKILKHRIDATNIRRTPLVDIENFFIDYADISPMIAKAVAGTLYEHFGPK